MMKKTLASLAILAMLLLAGCASNGRPYSMVDFASWFAADTNSRDSNLTFTKAARASSSSEIGQTAKRLSIANASDSLTESNRNPALTVSKAARAVSETQRNRSLTFYNASKAIRESQGR